MKIKIVDMAEVRKLEKFIGGKMYSVTGSNARGVEIAVVIPYGKTKGPLLFLASVKQFVRAAWRTLV